MSLIKRQKQTLVLQQRIGLAQADELLIKFLKNGHITDPDSLGLPSFDPYILEHNDFEHAGHEDELLMYSAQKFISNKKQLIPVEIKIYFLSRKIITNGMGIFGNMRLHKFLETSAFLLKEKNISVNIYLGRDLKEGALFFSNGVAMRFSDNGKSLNNYYINTVESNSIGNEKFSFQNASLSSIESIYDRFSYDNLINCRFSRKPAIRKLLKSFSKLISVSTCAESGQLD
ncbi:hypothetical protein RY831_01105 [Noviherbaspirillum sp. CPCC 100848]|uniref:Uncharacterized protein n=1 Tax=Noviherbaspirillum album TaxID=3080276 RepID=A0ABU6J286_9BURK|nr:hypothetical protein [Noviherbaspirillum sp. CPCC 100848]MEC4717736.1 hypothetical protein [Noviherbaspirillum sp. CPCC 100848]